MNTDARETFFGYLNRFGVIIALLASLATLIGVWIQISPNKLELSFNLFGIENPTFIPGVPDLDGRFRFRGQEVKDLLILKVRAWNSGKGVLVGQGERKNIITDQLSMAVPEYLKIISIEKKEGDLPAQIHKRGENSFDISFTQWKPGESIEFYLYAEGIKREQQKPKLISVRRDLIGGDILVFSNTETREKSSVLYRLFGNNVGDLLRLVAFLSCIVFVMMIIFLAMEPIKEVYRRAQWRRSNEVALNEFIETRFRDKSEQQKNKFRSNPELIYSALWEGYKGEIPEKTFAGDNLSKAIAFTFFISIWAIGAVVALVIVSGK